MIFFDDLNLIKTQIIHTFDLNHYQPCLALFNPSLFVSYSPTGYPLQPNTRHTPSSVSSVILPALRSSENTAQSLYEARHFNAAKLRRWSGLLRTSFTTQKSDYGRERET